LSLSATFCALFCNTITCFCVFTCIITSLGFNFNFSVLSSLKNRTTNAAKDFDAKKSSLIAKKVGDDLEVALEEGVIIFDNYFAVCATDLSCLVSLPKNICNILMKK
jgi:hypothetical protein